MIWLLLLVMTELGQPAPQRSQDRKCSDYADDGYYCVSWFQCEPETHTIKIHASNLFDPRTEEGECGGDYVDECDPPQTPEERKQALESSCDKVNDVCCQHPSSVTNITTQPEHPYEDACLNNANGDLDKDIFCQSLTTTTTSTTPCPVEDELFGGCGDSSTTTSTTTTPRPRPPPPNISPNLKCGHINPNGVDSINATPEADDAEFGEWPHVCAILKKEVVGKEPHQPLKIYQCGASLLDDGVLLTAAHCVQTMKVEDMIVRCGEWNTQNEEEKYSYQEEEVDHVEVHPEFNIDNHHNNFAVLFVKTNFERAPHINPICLPEPCPDYAASNCVANGWGKDKFGSDGRYSIILKEVAYPIVDNKQCQAALRKTRLGEFFRLDDSFICAGGIKDIDTCKGDGGSPLSCNIQGTNRWVQAGIVSWGIGCGEDGTPAVYASVASAVCWIDDMVTQYYRKSTSHFGFLKTDCVGGKSAKQCRSPIDDDNEIDEREGLEYYS